jgi:hypothetical protein
LTTDLFQLTMVEDGLIQTQQILNLCIKKQQQKMTWQQDDT